MTALQEYDRLESTGIWRESPESQRRDVIVSFGDASVIIRDRTGTAITHWSLPAIRRLNPSTRPAVFDPGEDDGETLEISDDTLIDAIEKIRKTIERRRPQHGRVRLAVLAVITTAVVALGVFWLPGVLVTHTSSVVPQSTRLSIGNALLGHLTRLTGDTCHSPLGTASLNRLKARVLGQDMRRAHIVPEGLRDTVLLPGQILLLNRVLVEDYDTPDVAAGYMLAALERSSRTDPLQSLLLEVGIGPTLHLLTTGKMDDQVLADYAELLLNQSEPEPDQAALIARFESSNIAISPYAYALDVTGETSLALIEADPKRGSPATRLLSDGDWISLQGICGE